MKRLIASLFHDKLSLDSISRLYIDPRVYQIYAKSKQTAAFQTYEQLKARLFEWFEQSGRVLPNGKKRDEL